MMEKLLTPVQVAMIIGCSKETARDKMLTMPGAVNIGTDGRSIVRIPESALEAWIANRTIRPMNVTKLERRKRSV